jgi:hypothetical protein
MNLMSIVKHILGGRPYFAYSLRVARTLVGLVYRLKISLLRSGCNIGPWKEGLFMNVRCPPNTLRNFWYVALCTLMMGKSLRPPNFVRIRALLCVGPDSSKSLHTAKGLYVPLKTNVSYFF